MNKCTMETWIGRLVGALGVIVWIGLVLVGYGIFNDFGGWSWKIENIGFFLIESSLVVVMSIIILVFNISVWK